MIDDCCEELSVHENLMSTRWIIQGALLIFMVWCKVMCSGVFEVSLLKLNNNRGVTHNGRCCSGQSTSPPCSEECQTFYSVCLLQYIQSMPSHRTCIYGYNMTSVLGSNNIRNEVEEDGLLIKLPINFEWPGKFTLIVESWHDSDGKQTIYDVSQLIIQAFISTSIYPSLSWRVDNAITPTTEMTTQFRLVCDRNYYGPGCDVLCRPRDDQFGHYTCDENGTKTCNKGWKGAFCDNPHCNHKCIQNRGVCERPFECRCRLGYTGINCGECRPYSGCLNGYCHMPYQCICRGGWTGQLCDIDTNYCNKVEPCMNGGTCINDVIGNYTCKCPSGFGGYNCQFPLCYDGYCQHGGFCQTRNGFRECSCLKTHYGNRCQNKKYSCDELHCQNDGLCSMGIQGGSCKCTELYTGDHCEFRKDPCHSNPCKNDAECRFDGDSLNGFKCICPIGYGGVFCAVSIDPCSSITCYNDGKCRYKAIDIVPHCVCSSGFTGEFCETHLDPCGGIMCLNNGICKHSTMGNGFICHCSNGYHGETCEQELNPCDSSPCRHGGVCKNYISNFLCICADGYSGTYCKRRAVTSHGTLSTQNDDTKPGVPSVNDDSDKHVITNGSNIKFTTNVILYILVLFTIVIIHSM